MFSDDSVLRIGENPIAPVQFAQSVMLSVFFVLIDQSTLRRFMIDDVGTSYLAVRALRSDSPLLTTECLQATLSAGSNWIREEMLQRSCFPTNLMLQ